MRNRTLITVLLFGSALTAASVGCGSTTSTSNSSAPPNLGPFLSPSASCAKSIANNGYYEVVSRDANDQPTAVKCYCSGPPVVEMNPDDYCPPGKDPLNDPVEDSLDLGVIVRAAFDANAKVAHQFVDTDTQSNIFKTELPKAPGFVGNNGIITAKSEASADLGIVNTKDAELKTDKPRVAKSGGGGKGDGPSSSGGGAFGSLNKAANDKAPGTTAPVDDEGGPAGGAAYTGGGTGGSGGQGGKGQPGNGTLDGKGLPFIIDYGKAPPEEGSGDSGGSASSDGTSTGATADAEGANGAGGAGDSAGTTANATEDQGAMIPPMGTPDREDYFTLIGAHENIFEVVTRHYMRRAKDWEQELQP